MDAKEFFALLNGLIGTKVEIINKSGIHKGTYASSLVSLKNDRIGLAQPMYHGAWMFMSGVELLMRIKEGDNLLEATVFSRETSSKDSAVPVLWVVLNGEIRKVQRRNFLRVPCSLLGKCCALNNPEMKGWFEVLLKNVSLGGVAVAARQSVDSAYFSRGERYLLAADFGSGILFLDSLLRNILAGEEDKPTGAFSFEGLSVSQEKIMGGFVRKLELANKS